MFTYYFVPVAGQPLPQVERALLDALRHADELAAAAYREGGKVHGQPAAGSEPARIQMTAGTPTRSLHGTFVPLTWEVTGRETLFDRLDADLVLAELGPHLVHLAFRGTYPRPARRARRGPRQAVLHRATELVVKGFLDRLTAEVRARLPSELPA